MLAVNSPTRNQTCVPCIAKRILNHWTTEEVPRRLFSCSYLRKICVCGKDKCVHSHHMLKCWIEIGPSLVLSTQGDLLIQTFLAGASQEGAAAALHLFPGWVKSSHCLRVPSHILYPSPYPKEILSISINIP